MKKRGNPRLADQRNSDTTNANLARQLKADEFVLRQLPLMLKLMKRDLSNREQAEWLNANGHKTRDHNDWSERAVYRYWQRVRSRKLRPPRLGFVVSADDISDPH